MPALKPWEMHQAWEARRLARTRGHIEKFALHDFAGDGVPELHSASYRKQEPLEVFVLGLEGGGHGSAFGDLDGDGRRDLVAPSELGLFVFLNQGY